MRRGARIGWVALGALALAAALAGVWTALRSVPEAPTPAAAPADTGGGALLAAHASPRPLAPIAFSDSEGRARTLGDFRGKVVLLNVWATWCVPCREEMPALDRLQRKLGGPRFEVVALSIDNGGIAAVKRFYGEIGIRALEIYVDSGSAAMGPLGILGVPTTLLVDAQGRELGRRTGPAVWDGPQSVRMIEARIAGAKP